MKTWIISISMYPFQWPGVCIALPALHTCSTLYIMIVYCSITDMFSPHASAQNRVWVINSSIQRHAQSHQSTSSTASRQAHTHVAIICCVIVVNLHSKRLSRVNMVDIYIHTYICKRYTHTRVACVREWWPSSFGAALLCASVNEMCAQNRSGRRRSMQHSTQHLRGLRISEVNEYRYTLDHPTISYSRSHRCQRLFVLSLHTFYMHQ